MDTKEQENLDLINKLESDRLEKENCRLCQLKVSELENRLLTVSVDALTKKVAELEVIIFNLKIKLNL